MSNVLTTDTFEFKALNSKIFIYVSSILLYPTKCRVAAKYRIVRFTVWYCAAAP